MSRSRQLIVVAGIVGVGVVAALPFARQSPPVPHAPSAGHDLPAPDVRLHLSAESASSPAVGLYDHDAPQNPFNSPRIARSQLEDNGLPPELPERYHPLIEDRAGTNRESQVETLPPARPRNMELTQPGTRKTESAKPRTHRIVDGDTLARIAARYWGDPQLANQLWEANRNVLAAPDPLPIGVTLNIPARPENQPATTSPPREELPAPARQPALTTPSATPAEGTLPLVPIPAGAFR
jgi:nucleoid-associated protein YgaU